MTTGKAVEARRARDIWISDISKSEENLETFCSWQRTGLETRRYSAGLKPRR